MNAIPRNIPKMNSIGATNPVDCATTPRKNIVMYLYTSLSIGAPDRNRTYTHCFRDKYAAITSQELFGVDNAVVNICNCLI